MNPEKSNRKYRTFDPSVGYPAGAFLFYECLRCGDIVPSMPDDSAHCTCRNVMIDVDYGRISVQDVSQIRLFSES